MAFDITAVYNGSTDSPGIDLTINDTLGFSALLVERFDNSGNYATLPVRGLNHVTVGSSTVITTDFEAPIGLSVKYRATAFNSDPQITFVGAGTESSGTSSASPTYPAGTVSTSQNLLTVVVKPYTATVSTPSGWTLVTNKTSGTTASGADVGSVNVYVFRREGAFTGTQAVTATGSNVVLATIEAFNKGVLAAWSVSAVSGADETAGDGHSSTATTSLTPLLQDLLFTVVGFNNDDFLMNQPETFSLSQPNASLGTLAMARSTRTSDGDNVGIENIYSTVQFASGTGAPTVTKTTPGITMFGSSVFVLLSTTASSQATDESGSVTIPYDGTGDAWVKSVFNPLLSQQVHVQEYPSTSFNPKILGNYNVLGRVHPVVITDAWGSRTGSFTLLSGREDLTPFKELKDLITTGGTLMFQTTGDVVNLYPDMYLEVEDYSVERLEILSASPEVLYKHEIKFIEVDQPDTSDAGLSLRTYQDVLDAYTTYQAVKDGNTTYLVLLAG